MDDPPTEGDHFENCASQMTRNDDENLFDRNGPSIGSNQSGQGHTVLPAIREAATAPNNVSFQNNSTDSGRSRMSQITLVSISMSIMSWISNQWNNFIQIYNGTFTMSSDVIHILKVIGIADIQQMKAIVKGLHATSYRDLLMLHKDEWVVVCVEAGIKKQRAERVWQGLEIFKSYYSEQVNSQSRSSINFSPTSYNNIIHSQRLESLFVSSKESPPSLLHQLGMANMNTISPMQSSESQSLPAIQPTKTPNPLATIRKSDVIPHAQEDESTNNQSTKSPSFKDDNLLASIINASPNIDMETAHNILSAISSSQKPKTSTDIHSVIDNSINDDSSVSNNQQSSDTNAVDQKSNSIPKGISWGININSDPNPIIDDESGEDSDDSDTSGDLSDDDNSVSVGAFKLSDVANMKIPHLPIGKRDYESFMRQLMNRFAMNGSDSLIHLDTTKRTLLPTRRRTKYNKLESAKKFKRRRRLYKKRNKTILLVLKEMANNAKHYLAKDLQKFDCGVEAFDFLVQKMDPMSVDPTNENASAFEKFQKLELTAISSGSFGKFFSLFEHQISELVESDGIKFTEEYTKSLLISKLKHISYATMKLPSATRNDYKSYVNELRQFAVIIEKDQPYKKALLNNTNTSSQSNGKNEIDNINGYKIDERGNANRKDFKGMSDDQRKAFLKRRREYIDDSNTKFKRNPKFEADAKTDKGDKYNKMQSSLQGKINNLQKELKDSKGNDDPSKEVGKDDKQSLINNVKSLNMPDEQQKKIIAYMEKHVKTTRVRTVHFNESLIKRANHLETSEERAPTIIDGGADTGMNGSAYIFLEHTLRKANVIGYDSDMVKTGMPIGTSVTATKDTNGDTVVLLQNEQIDHTSQPNSMMAPNQIRHYGIDIDDCPTCYDIDGRRGRQSLKADKFEIPFSYEKGLIYLHTWKPTDQELHTCPVIMLTSDAEWNPDNLSDNPNHHPDPTTWDPLNTCEDREIVNSNVRNIIARRVNDGVNVHVTSSTTRSQHLQVNNNDLPSAEALDDDTSSCISSIHSTSTFNGNDESSITSTASSDISNIFIDHHQDLQLDTVSLDSGGDESNISSVTGNPMTRYVLNSLTLDILHPAVKHNNFQHVNTVEVIKYVEQLANKNTPSTNYKYINANKSTIADQDWITMRKRLGWLPTEIIKKTFEVTTQLAKVDIRLPLRRHFKSRFPQANVNRLHETFSTDTIFASTKAINGESVAQLFVGNKSQLVVPYGMSKESEGPTKLQEFVRDWGAPDRLHRDNSKMQNSEAWKKIERLYMIKQSQSEPHNQQQNPAERKIQTVKNGVNRIMDRTETPKFMWFECLLFFSSILNITSCPSLNYKTPTQVAIGHTVDISPYIAHEWWEPVYYLTYEDPSFPESREKRGRFCGPIANCGDILTFKIYVPETHQIIHRSVLRSSKHDNGEPNRRAANPHYSESQTDDDDISDIDYVEELKASGEGLDDSDIPVELDIDSFNPTEDTLISMTELINKVSDNDREIRYKEIPDPKELVGFTFPMEHDGITQRATVKELSPDKDDAVIELMDGSRSLIAYHLLIEKFNAPSEDGNQIFTFKGISGHKCIKGIWNVRVEWDGHGFEPTWEPLTNMKKADPITLATYAKENNLLNKKGWKWAKKIKIDAAKLIRLAKRVCKAKRNDPKYMFGIKVPQSRQEAMDLDRENGNNLWLESIETETGQILEYDTFKILEPGEKAPHGYQFVPLTLVFAVKHDGRRKARLVAGGHVTDPGTDEVYSSVVAPEGVRIVIFIADHNSLDVMSGDVGNAYLNAKTREKIWVKFGPEFGLKIAGRVGIMIKSLYGLKTSSARWSEHLADTLRSMGWKESKAENDVWMKDMNTHYEYLAVYSDDIIVASKNPQEVMDEIRKTYIMKGVGVPDYFIGAEYGRIKGNYTDRGVTSTWSAKTYLKNVIEKIEKIYGNLRNYTCPMDPDYHPELDESELLSTEDISKYRMLTGSAQWAITLGRLDVVYATSMLSRYNNAPREGHILAMKKLFGYLKGHQKGKLVFDTTEMDTSNATFMDCADWRQVYGSNMKEELPPDMPDPKMKPITINVFFDASFGCDMLTRRSVTGIIIFLNSTPIKWYSKKQNTVETSTYGAELVAGRLACEHVMDYRYKLRMLGIPVNGPSIMLGDNMSVIQNCTLPSSQLKKKHNAIAYHRVRECVASGIIKLGHVSSQDNFADICTKALNGPKLHGLMKQLSH